MHESTRRAALGELAPALLALDLLRRDPSITRAAATLGVSQPTLSRMIRRWEQSLGVPLVSRVGREIRLTPAGAALADAAGTSLRVLTEALGAVSLPHSGTLRLGYLRSVSTTIVAELVSSFHRAHPDVPVAQREGPSGELLDLIDGDELDLAVVSPRPPARYGWTHLGRQRLALAVPAAHELADRPVIDLAEVASERFLALDPRFATRAQADALTEEAGFHPDVELQTDDLRTLREYVAEGHGIAILPVDGSHDPRVRNVAISSARAVRAVGLTWLRSRPLPSCARDLLTEASDTNRHYPGWGDLLDER